jgi:hypothetical protein
MQGKALRQKRQHEQPEQQQCCGWAGHCTGEGAGVAGKEEDIRVGGTFWNHLF